MRRACAATVLVVAIGAPPLVAQTAERFEVEHQAMGTTFRMVLYTADAALANRATHAAVTRIDELDRILSDYDPNSEISLLSQSAGTGQWVPVGTDLWTVLVSSSRFAVESRGAFDVTVGPVTQLWRWTKRRGVLPSAQRLARARSAVGRHLMELDHPTKRVRLLAPGMRLDVGGMGKGFAADAALRVLAEAGVRSALVDAGGDIAVGAPPPGRRGWRIDAPAVEAGARVHRTVLLADAAIATSGDTYRFVLVEGVRYSHVVDPRTGLGVTSPRIVTVVASTAAEADALASALSVVGSAGGRAILAGRRDVVGRVVERLAQERDVVFGCDRPPRFARHFCTEAVDDTAHAYSKHRH